MTKPKYPDGQPVEYAVKAATAEDALDITRARLSARGFRFGHVETRLATNGCFMVRGRLKSLTIEEERSS